MHQHTVQIAMSTNDKQDCHVVIIHDGRTMHCEGYYAEMDFSALNAGFVHDTNYAASHHYKAIKAMNLRGAKA